MSGRVSAARRIVAAIGAVGLGAGVLAGCGTSSATASREASARSGPTIPLTSSSVTGTTTWATLAMGHLDDPLNTFWQLLTLNGARWSLATPPGVASNGGLVAAAAPTSVLAGFGPSQDLQFSPLALTADRGSSWQAGVLSAGLSLVPDALAQGAAGGALALLSSAGGKVVAGSSGNLSTWTAVVTASALRRQSGLADCHLRSLTAVALDAHGSTLVGGSCARGGRAGLFTPSSDGWMSVGPRLPGASSGPTEVVRLDQTAAGTAALVSAGGGTETRLFALWSTNGLGPWTVSAGLPLDGASLLSTGVTGAGAFVVSTRRGSAAPSASTVGPTESPWKSLPPLPSGTTSVTAGPGGSYDALVPVQSTLSVYGLGTSGWSRVQTLRVPVQYGSSN
jgi:hypothetical protein